ncbi:MAG: hypothetical protein JXR03_14785 [Cyclobacteriaceae bacterium]
MKTDLTEIQTSLQEMFLKHVPPLQIRKNNKDVFEAAGTKEAMQGKQKVDGFYFGSVIPKPKDIRLYYFPIYTHQSEFEWISDDLRKCMKGKSCFHIKKLSPDLEAEIQSMITKGVEVYLKNDLI